MSGISRIRLKKNLGQRKLYHATFELLGHKHTKHKAYQTVQDYSYLLTDVYEIDQHGRKIRLPTNRINLASKGKQLSTDHTWVDFRAGLFMVRSAGKKFVGNELLAGDEIEFSAVVEEYPIVRDDILKTRNTIWRKAHNTTEKMFLKWKSASDQYYDKIDNVNRQLDDLYDQYHCGQIDYDNFKQQKQELFADAQKIYPGSLDQLQSKQKKIFEQAKKDISDIKLVDYKLVDLRNIRCVTQKPAHYGWTRLTYDRKRIRDIAYVRYLAARSLSYRDKIKYSDFERDKK